MERCTAGAQLNDPAASPRRNATAAPATVSTVAAVTGHRSDDEPDSAGWTPREQRSLEFALRENPPSGGASTKKRWRAIADAVSTKTPLECLQRCRALTAAVKARQLPPLLTLQQDVLFSVLEWLGGRGLCALACTAKTMRAAAHDDALWLPLADALPGTWSFSRQDRLGEAPWAYCLRVRQSLYGSWHMLTEHRAGTRPYLSQLGRVDERRCFTPHKGILPYRLKYGAICELVQLEALREGGLNHRVYKAVADLLIQLSANSKSRVPPELHMTVREIFKTCYPGFGAGTGSGAYAPGLQAGGSSTKASTSGSMLGKGVATMKKKVQDEEMRKRLETCHEFLALVP